MVGTQIRYYVILEPVSFQLNKLPTKDFFKLQNPAKKVLSFLQIGILIQNLHVIGFTHQEIELFNIVSVDAQITDLRLYDFTFSVKIGEPGTIGSNSYYYSPDKFVDNFIAAPSQDAFAFGLTMLNLLDSDKKAFDKAIKKNCPEDRQSFTDKCKYSFKLGAEAVRKSNPELNDLLEYIKAHLFDEKEPLNLKDSIVFLYELFKRVYADSAEKDPIMEKQAEEIYGNYLSNLELLSKKETAPENIS